MDPSLSEEMSRNEKGDGELGLNKLLLSQTLPVFVYQYFLTSSFFRIVIMQMKEHSGFILFSSKMLIDFTVSLYDCLQKPRRSLMKRKMHWQVGSKYFENHH